MTTAAEPAQAETVPPTREETEARMNNFIDRNREFLTKDIKEGLTTVVASLAKKVSVTNLPQVEVTFNVDVTEENQKQHVRVDAIPHLAFQETHDSVEKAKNLLLEELFNRVVADRKEQRSSFFN